MEQVCEWAQQLELDATSFHDYGITGAVLLGLSDDDMRVRPAAYSRKPQS